MSIQGKGLDIFGRGERGPRYQMIACEVLYRECCWAVAVSRNVIDVHFLTQGLHDLESARMAERIQAEIDAAPAGRYAAILLGFALCNGGTIGLAARDVPIVIPRAHDCITLFMGSKEAYQKHFSEQKGSFYLTTGWAERDKDNLEDTMGREDNILRKMGLDKTYEEYVAMYGEEYARLILGTIGGLEHYGNITHIEMGIAPASEERVREAARAEAERRGWGYETVPGRMDLMTALADGDWDEERFLILKPGERLAQAYDERIVRAE